MKRIIELNIKNEENSQMNLNKIRLQDKKLYLIANSDAFKREEDFLDAVAACLKGGVKIVQLREKNSSASRIIKLGKRIRELCSIYNALFIVNDRVDIAKAIEADGVHLGQDDINIDTAREILGPNAIIGMSTHSLKQAVKAQTDGADYISVGPVFGEQAVGLEGVKWASENIGIHFFAIGGIDLGNLQEVIDSGATRVAVARTIINSSSPEDSIKSILKKLK